MLTGTCTWMNTFLCFYWYVSAVKYCVCGECLWITWVEQRQLQYCTSPLEGTYVLASGCALSRGQIVVSDLHFISEAQKNRKRQKTHSWCVSRLRRTKHAVFSSSCLCVKSEANVPLLTRPPLSHFCILGSSSCVYLLFSLWLFNTET